MDDGRQTRGTARAAVFSLLGVAIVAVLAPLLPATPAAAAPPGVTHPALVDPDPVDNTPHVLNGRTEAVLDLGAKVVVGGTFTSVKRYSQPATFARSYLFAYDKATGAIDTAFLPQPNGRISALLKAPDGKILVSGQFTSIGGRSIRNVAKIDPATGAAVAAFAPTPNGMVYDMHLAGGHLYLGGSFTKVGSATRTNFAVIDPASGAVRAGADVAFNGAPRGKVNRIMRLDVTPDGKKLVAIGNFARVGGQVRENVAVLDLTTAGSATVAGWRTDRYKDLTCGNAGSSWDTITYDVDIAPAGGWFVIVTTGGPGGTSKLCDSAVRWEIGATGAASPTWINWTGGDSLTSVAVTGAAVYVAGHNRWVDNPEGRDSAGPGSFAVDGIAALSPSNGKAIRSWNPGRATGLVAPRIVPTAEGLYVLSDSDKFAGEFHPKLTYLTLTGELPPTGNKPGAPVAPAVTTATRNSATVTWGAAASTSPITGYQVDALVGGRSVASKDAGTARTAAFTGLPAGAVVTFSVTARTAAGSGPAAVAPTVLPFTSVDAFTTRQLRDLIGRAPNGAELSDWRTRLANGSATPQSLVDGLLDTASVGRIAAVVRLYQAYYLRLPDGGGFRYWRDQVRAGVSVDKVSQSFASAAEFKKKYGSLDDGEFVDLVYENVLGRRPDGNGRAYWVSQLRKGVSRGKVMTGFSESAENKAATKAETDIVLVTHLLLDRRPTDPELRTALSRLNQVKAVLTGTEYDGRV